MRRRLGRFWTRRCWGFGSRLGLDLAQAVVEIDVKVLLPLVGVGQIVAEDFVLAAQAGDFGLQLVDLVGELELGPGARFQLVETAAELGAHGIDARPGFIVVKQAGLDRKSTRLNSSHNA